VIQESLSPAEIEAAEYCTSQISSIVSKTIAGNTAVQWPAGWPWQDKLDDVDVFLGLWLYGMLTKPKEGVAESRRASISELAHFCALEITIYARAIFEDDTDLGWPSDWRDEYRATWDDDQFRDLWLSVAAQLRGVLSLMPAPFLWRLQAAMEARLLGYDGHTQGAARGLH